jgi:hypothetical protein
MKKLRNLLVVAILSLPLVAANAGTLIADAAPVDLDPTQSVHDWCYYYWGGHWWMVPC